VERRVGKLNYNATLSCDGNTQTDVKFEGCRFKGREITVVESLETTHIVTVTIKNNIDLSPSETNPS